MFEVEQKLAVKALWRGISATSDRSESAHADQTICLYKCACDKRSSVLACLDYPEGGDIEKPLDCAIFR